MTEPPPEELEVEILRTRDVGLVKELSLVLNSVGIRHRVVGNQHQQWILTHPAQAQAAIAELQNYHGENQGRGQKEEQLVPKGGALTQVLLWATALCLVHVLAQAGSFGLDWKRAGAVNGEAIREGELWRAVTALTLHADAEHLISNLFFGALFLGLLHQVVGAARSWSVLVFAGAAGNLVNALVVGDDLRSLGASTAVFAALGALTAVQWSRKVETRAGRAKRWIPLIAGALLLGWNGMGGVSHDPWIGIQRPPDDNTDIGAHVAGFLCGLVAGALLWRRREWLDASPLAQHLLAWAPPLTVITAWGLAATFR